MPRIRNDVTYQRKLSTSVPFAEKQLVAFRRTGQYVANIFRPREIDTYGVIFDINVPADDYFPEVLQINIVEIEFDNGEYANEVLPFKIDPVDYIGKKIFAIPRCCQRRKGSTDQVRVLAWRVTRLLHSVAGSCVAPKRSVPAVCH